MSSHVRGPRSASSNTTPALNTPVRQNTFPAGVYQDDMINPAQEQQSIYGEPVLRAGNEYEGEDYHNPNPRKRVNTEGGLDNPKKRAAVAVRCFSSITVSHLPL